MKEMNTLIKSGNHSVSPEAALVALVSASIPVISEATLLVTESIVAVAAVRRAHRRGAVLIGRAES